ncbi:FAD-dependent oxidoreductase [Streptosporangium sp. NPDC048047]|uniref:flavin-containing monooxygenase n=1 Tax=Streptosporangium sp. NPDC048047 TaxID=3155748 RepID=UPI0034359D58
MSDERFDTVVIGGGQAGLAAGYHLKRRGRDFVILDAAHSVGQSWRSRWDSLRLFTPAHFTHLPGLPFPAPRRHLPSKDEMAGYLEAYATRFELPLRLGRRVDRLRRASDRGGYVISSTGRIVRAGNVIVATGPAMTPRLPGFAGQVDPATVTLHSSDYRNPGQLPNGPVLVVGAGNSGAEIALDLAPARRTLLAGRSTGRFPIGIGGPVYRVMNRVLSTDTAWGRKIAAKGSGKGTPLVRVREEDLARAGVERLPRVTGTSDGCPALEDGRVCDVAAVIWCTGYVPDYSWIELPRFPAAGPPDHHRGVVSGQPGMYLIGLPFLSSMASSLVGGVGRDARHIVSQLDARRAGSGWR